MVPDEEECGSCGDEREYEDHCIDCGEDICPSCCHPELDSCCETCGEECYGT